MKKLFGLIALSLAILFIGTQTAEACTCSGRPQGVKGFQTCSSYWYSEAVFIGSAQKVSIENNRMIVEFSVEKPLRGASEKTVEIFTSPSSASCGYPFKEGERYFVYARRGSDGKLTVALCSPTVLLKDAEDDLEYVQELELGKSGTRIFGTVSEDKQKNYNDKRSFEPLAGIEITIKGRTPARFSGGKSIAQGKEHTFKTTTDDKGFYIFREIPEGVYKVVAKFSNGLREIVTREDLIEHYAAVRSDGIRCDSENFVATRQGSIRGKVTNFDGKGIENSWNPESPQPYVSLLPLDENNKVLSNRAFLDRWAYRDKFEFFFNIVPAGNYLLAINSNNCPYPNNGMPTMFFPGVANQSEAKIITVKEGENLILEDFRALPNLKERWFSGAVLYADKTLASNVTVRLSDGNMNKCGNLQADVKTDESGRFKIKGFESYEYKINAFTERKNGQKQFYTKPFEAPKEGASDNIRLVLEYDILILNQPVCSITRKSFY